MTNWENLTMPGIEELRQKTRTVIVPVGALEEHGPHLPLGTDTFHALELARRVAQRCPVVVAPPAHMMARSAKIHSTRVPDAIPTRWSPAWEEEAMQ